MSAKRKLIREQTVEELAEYLKSNNFPSFRAKQIMDWLWKKNVGSFEEMKNIGKNLQEFLNSNLANLFNLEEIRLAKWSSSSQIKLKFWELFTKTLSANHSSKPAAVLI